MTTIKEFIAFLQTMPENTVLDIGRDELCGEVAEFSTKASTVQTWRAEATANKVSAVYMPEAMVRTNVHDGKKSYEDCPSTLEGCEYTDAIKQEYKPNPVLYFELSGLGL